MSASYKTKSTEQKVNGWIKVSRDIRSHWLWDDPIKFKWWVDILMEVNHSPQKVSIGFELFECKAGQSLNSLLTWSKRWRVDISTVRRFFQLLKRDELVFVENVKKTTRLTVCNYDSYTNERHSTQRRSNREAIQTRTNKECNENDNTLFLGAWDSYDKKIDKPLAEKIWRNLTDQEQQAAIQHIPHYVMNTPKKYRKNFHRYLSNKCYNDEIIPITHKSKSNGNIEPQNGFPTE